MWKQIARSFWLAAYLGLASAPQAMTEEFSLQVGSPVAAQGSHLKSSAVFAFRTKGCAEPARSEVSGTAEGLLNGERRSIPLKMAAVSTGVYVVSQQWPGDGVWVVNLTGRCAGAAAGALVAVGARGFVREDSKFFSRPVNEPEIAALLKTRAGGKD